jgi:hypothetical protein
MSPQWRACSCLIRPGLLPSSPGSIGQAASNPPSSPKYQLDMLDRSGPLCIYNKNPLPGRTEWRGLIHTGSGFRQARSQLQPIPDTILPDMAGEVNTR